MADQISVRFWPQKASGSIDIGRAVLLEYYDLVSIGEPRAYASFTFGEVQ